MTLLDASVYLTMKPRRLFTYTFCPTATPSGGPVKGTVGL